MFIAAAKVQCSEIGNGIVTKYHYFAVDHERSRSLRAPPPQTGQPTNSCSGPKTLGFRSGHPRRAQSPFINKMDQMVTKIPGSGMGKVIDEQRSGFNRALANTCGENADRITAGVMAAAKNGSEVSSILSRKTHRFDSTEAWQQVWMICLSAKLKYCDRSRIGSEALAGVLFAMKPHLSRGHPRVISSSEKSGAMRSRRTGG
jgi:hypothetical protein